MKTEKNGNAERKNDGRTNSDQQQQGPERSHGRAPGQTHIHISLAKTLRDQIDEACAKEDIKRSQLLRRAVRQYLKQELPADKKR